MTGNAIAGRSYGFERHLEETTVDEALARVTTALQAEGFGILTRIDMKEILKKKIDVEFRPYLILGACNPALAHKALNAEPQIGLLLPCNVVVQQEGAAGAVVSIADPRAMFAVVGNPALAPVVDEAETRLRRVITAL